jgi:hypothetical protein
LIDTVYPSEDGNGGIVGLDTTHGAIAHFVDDELYLLLHGTNDGIITAVKHEPEP